MYAALWSGGKDSCLALWRARASGLPVAGLVNLFDRESGRVRFHAVRASLIADQATALGLKLFQYATGPDDFEAAFERALGELKQLGYQGVVAGDIHLEDVRRWNEERTARAGLALVEPLWQQGGLALLEELVAGGFRAVLTCCDQTWPRVLWPGREIDAEFISDMSRTPGIDACGERGEYHSFAFDGPLFSTPVAWSAGQVRQAKGFSQLDLVPGAQQARARAGAPTVPEA